MRAPTVRLLAASALFVGAAAALSRAHADASPTEERLRSALKETTLQLREAQDELATLRAQQSALQEQLAAAQAHSGPKAAVPAPDASGGLRRQLAQRDTEAGQLRQQLQAAQESLAKWQSGYQQAVDLARSKDAESRDYKTRFDATSAHDAACTADNAELVTIANDLLQSYRDKGVFSAIADAEPLTQIHRVKLETLAQQYHARIKDAEVIPPEHADAQDAKPAAAQPAAQP
jgi:DNA repair exonuclease SbcCD ATPase subunit